MDKKKPRKSDIVGNCAICGERKYLARDHDHVTGFLRGLICYKCNTGLGFFGDTIENVESAAAYLRNPPLAQNRVEWPDTPAQRAERARRAPGQGMIRQLPNGRWEARITVNYQPRSFYGQTREEASERLEAAKVALTVVNGASQEELLVARHIHELVERQIRRRKATLADAYHAVAEKSSA